MGASTDQAQFVTLDAVYDEPVGFDVGLPISFPNAPKRMVAMARGQWLLFDQRLQQHPQLAQILTSRPGPSDVALELRRTNGVSMSDVEVAEQLLGAVETLTLASVEFLHGPDGGRVLVPGR